MLEKLKEFLDPQQISTSTEDFANYGKDWTKHFEPKPLVILFPKSTDEVVSIVNWARTHKVALVPSGGRTGLSGAAIATNGEAVVSFEKMNKIKDFNTFDETVTCEPGVITEDLQNFVQDKGYLFPVDFAARGSSQIGGNVATNAGGIKVIRYGLMRNWVASLTVVTGAGEVLNLNNSLVKNATGYDFRQLFIGSEGTLGFITEVELRFTRPTKELATFVFGVETLDSVMNIYAEYKKQFPLMAYEMFTELATQYVVEQGHVNRPFETATPYYILMEIENESSQTMDQAMEAFENCMEKGWILDGVVSQSPQQAKDLWRLREDITEATSHKEPYKNDVSVRVSKVPQFLKEMNAILEGEYPDFDVVWFGHVGDGNLHINILKPDNLNSDDFLKQCHQVDQKLFSMIEKLGGSVSAEHGVGLTKKPYLHHTRSQSEISLMKKVKSILDPDGIMNPGKIFE